MRKIINIKLWTCIGVLLLGIRDIQAQQMGPTAPDFAGFEPIDGTDMVNLISGDMTYTLPLLEVPGPNGSYPIVVSNHAGIAYDQEASWVGLGWRLTPGALNRAIRGVADDIVSKRLTITEVTGKKSYRTVGVNIGLNYSESLNLSLGVQASFGDVNTVYGSVGLSSAIGSATLGSNGSLTVNSSSLGQNNGISASATVNYKGGSSAGINSNGLGVSMNQNGISSVSLGDIRVSDNVNSYGGKNFTSVTRTSSFSIPITHALSLYFASSEMTWKAMQINDPVIRGVFHYRPANTWNDPDNANVYDITSLDESLDIERPAYNKAAFLNELIDDESGRMMFPALDKYSVLAQGVNMSIRPNLKTSANLYGFGRVMRGENRVLSYADFNNAGGYSDWNKNMMTQFGVNYVNNGFGEDYGIMNASPNIDFLVENSNANYFRVLPKSHKSHYNKYNTPPPGIMSFDYATPDYLTQGEYNYKKDNTGIHSGNINSFYKEQGAVAVNFFTNSQILSYINNDVNETTNGYIRPNASYPAKRTENDMVMDGIGAFQVTNEQGVTYHYGIPVYQRESITKALKPKGFEEKSTTVSFSKDAYAITWLLTGITGPDYVDVNGDHLLDEGDYGYWVQFNYGQFSKHYRWNNISNYNDYQVGGKDPLSVENHGFKDVYYLNSIKTATHTALFIKGIREDGVSKQSEGLATIEIGEDINANANEDGACPKDAYCYDYTFTLYGGGQDHRLMKLDKVLLLKNEDVPVDFEKLGSHDLYTPLTSGQYTKAWVEGITFAGSEWDGDDPDDYDLLRDYHTGSTGYKMDNILDYKDFETQSLSVYKKALNIIEFNHDYSLLAGNVTTSIDGQIGTHSIDGRLTLNEIKYLKYDHDNNNLISVKPSHKFDYYNDFEYVSTPVETFDGNANKSLIYSLAKSNTDNWGYLNTDYNIMESHNGSLKSIETPIGAKIEIEYEEDTYKNEYLFGMKQQFHIDYFEVIEENNVCHHNFASGNNIYRFHMTNPIGDYFSVGDQIELDYHLESYKEKKYIIPNFSNPLVVDEFNFTGNSVGSISNIDSDKMYIDVILSTYNSDFETVLDKVHSSVDCMYPNYKLAPGLLDILDISVEKSNYPNLAEVKGGGLRVKKIILDDLTGNRYTDEYFYDKNNRTSGVTSYAPKKNSYNYYIPYVESVPTPAVYYSEVRKVSKSVNNVSDSYEKYVFDLPEYSINVHDKDFEIPGFFKVETEYDAPVIFNNHYGDNYGYPHANEYSFGAGLNYTKTGAATRMWAKKNHNWDDVRTHIHQRKSIVHNQLSNIGRLLGRYEYNSLGQEISSLTNQYYDFNEIESGILQESYENKRYIADVNENYTWENYYNTLSSKVHYSSTLKSITSKAKGVKNITENNDYDILLGVPRIVITENSFGDRHRTSLKYAYEVYSEMGAKSENTEAKNMLSQIAASYLYFDNGNDDHSDDPVINASVTTWNKDWKYREFDGGKYQTVDHYPNSSTAHKDIWRKKTTYSWRSKLDPETGAYLKTDGLNLFNTDDEFDFANEHAYGNNALGWVKNSEVMFYDHYSNPREVKDVNGQFASSKTWKGLTVSNVMGAAYSGYCATGAEELIKGKGYSVLDNPRYFETETKLGNEAELVQTQAHTGKHAVVVQNTNREAFISTFYLKSNTGEGDQFDPIEHYILSVWVKGNIGTKATHIKAKVKLPDSNSYMSLDNPEIIQAGDWYQLRYTFQTVTSYVPSNTTVEVSVGSAGYSGPLHFDDYRLYPVGASVTTYVYDDQDRIEYMLDGNNLGTKYVYDNRGRLKEIYSEKVGADGGFVQTAETKYHMIRDNE